MMPIVFALRKEGAIFTAERTLQANFTESFRVRFKFATGPTMIAFFVVA